MADLVNVPDAPGVPAVLFAATAGLPIALAVADAVGLPFLPFTQQQWGLFRSGAPAVVADTVLGFEYKSDFLLSDYPLERGGFETYDKVNAPDGVRLRYVAGGSLASRTALLQSCKAVVGTLDIFDAVTPEFVHRSVNVIHMDYRRTSRDGLGMLQIDLICQEVRISRGRTTTTDPSATGETGDTAAPSGADQVNGGQVQATDATSGQISTVGTQDFTGGYNVSGYDVNAIGANTTVTGDVGELTVADGLSGQALPEGTVPATTSSISGLSPAGPDQPVYFNPL
ncbi:hypothetical protein Q8W71_13805 [Methylobacterium sp. NEAU 140]|uniref:hypothetical protein n=1 Tax=Methylobacterium sp. NEAU 140 TaxID=3064945 RepID=UPI002736D7BD|nr:hypothetical protein [Methylobacterium sp. NEAU 140]MDP4023706.1 hypothetical protein [Methylobacterium sp. NEAU 140]